MTDSIDVLIEKLNADVKRDELAYDLLRKRIETLRMVIWELEVARAEQKTKSGVKG